MRLLAPLVFALTIAPAAALAQTCDSETFTNGSCDCGCGSVDPECPAGADFKACQTNRCPNGKVPEATRPAMCQASTCGDGWRLAQADEACDDGDTLATGGCNATCNAVNPGYVCGTLAAGCQLDQNPENPDAGQPSSDGGTGGGGGGATGGGSGGGTATGGGSGGGSATGGGSGGGAAGGGGGGASSGTGNNKPPPGSEPMSAGCTASGGALLGLAGLALLRRRRP